MRTYEKVPAAILAVTVPAELLAAAASDGGGGAWSLWVGVGCAVLQLTAMALVKITAHKNIEEVRK